MFLYNIKFLKNSDFRRNVVGTLIQTSAYNVFMLRKQKLLKFITNIMNVNFFQPKLTLAKCRKNVENFLEACRKLGVHRVSERTITTYL